MEAEVVEGERATSLYREAFAAFGKSRRAEPEWLAELRRRAFARFEELGFPTPRMEAWKYTGVAPIARTAFRAAELAGEPAGVAVPEFAAAGPRLVFVNGTFRRDLSSVPADGSLTVSSLRQALAERGEALERHLARQADWEDHAFTAWNTAFFTDGAFLEIPRGAVLPAPIELLFLARAGAEPIAAHPRNLIVVGPQSQAVIVERYAGRGDPYLTNAVTEISVGEGAVLDHTKLQRESPAGYHVHTIQARLESRASFTSHNVALGAALARTDINVLFDGEGGECTLNGLFIGEDSQHLDTHTFIDHARPHCGSRELYKGILDEKSRGVFHGTIVVRPGAQKTDAMQTNKNLLLSSEALVDSTPALEIFADDVKCKHGSTIGQLDANALFYLRSRGIAEREARAILTYAFAADVAGRLRLPAVRAEIEELLAARLSGAPLSLQEVLP
jgi:Fe-S cluster assembly protein SufD